MHSFGRALRSHFLLADDATFLNHGSFGACPKDVLAEQGRIRLTMEAEPDVFFRRDVMPLAGETTLRRAAGKVAEFVHAPTECVAFVENATAGIQAALRSIELGRGERILVTSHTYNAMRLMVEERCAQTGASPLVVEIPVPTAADDIVWRLDQALATHVKVAIIDHITSPTALVMPLARIIPKLHAHGARVIIDGAHAIGQVPIDLEALGADWYVSNLHKWLFAPKGTALLYASKKVAPTTRPNVVSHFIAMGFPASFDYTGTRDNSGWLAAPAAIRFFEDLGPERVRAYQKRLLQTVDELLTGIGADPVAPIEMNAAMRSFVLPQRRAATPEDADALLDALWTRHRIQVWTKDFAGHLLLRVSAQVYVDEADLRRLRDVLKAEGWPAR
jgi:isopenicillin-N epimerase